MHKRFRKTNTQKYKRKKYYVGVEISDTSSDESSTHKVEEEQENKKRPQILNRSKVLSPLTPQNKFRPLAVSVSQSTCGLSSVSPATKYEQQPKETPVTHTSSCRSPWLSVRTTLGMLKSSRSMLQTSLSESTVEESFIECSPMSSLEANLLNNTEQRPAPNNGKKIAQSKTQNRCLKGGYLQEYLRLMHREHMDHRSIQHNQRLGIRGQRVQVLSIHECFGAYMARVQQEQSIYNVIITSNMAASIQVGVTLELHFDVKVEHTYQLENDELVYIQPNKIVIFKV